MTQAHDKETSAKVQSRRVLARLLPYFLVQKRLIAIAAIGLLINTASVTVVPWMVKVAIDRYISVGDVSGLTWLLAIFIANAAVGWVTNVVASFSLYRATQSVLYRLRSSLVSHLHRHSISFYDKNSVGGLMSRVVGDVYEIEAFFLGAWIIGPVLHLAGIMVAVLILSLKLGLISMSAVPVLMLFVVMWHPYETRAYGRQRRAEAGFSESLNENLAGVRVIQSVNRQRRNMEILEAKNRENLHASLFANRLSVLRNTPRGTLQGLSIGFAVFFGAQMVSDNALELGTFVAFALYIQRFFQPLHTLMALLTPFNRAMASGKRVFELLDTIPDVAEDSVDETVLPPLKGEVQFRNVSYSYLPGQEVLKNINLQVKPGQMVAIVGPTGAGKTTLVSLLSRFYELRPGEGTILLDGHDIQNVSRSSLAGQVGVVPQDPFLFSGTVRENIKYNHMDVTDDQTEEKAKAVGAHDFIVGLENGYDTFLEEGGVNLSVGQRQQLCLARAIVSNPRILILDEATSNIDSITEAKIQQALQQQIRSRTVIVIAHRLSTTRKADKIVVLNHGKVAEEGTHLELIEKAGLYAHLYRMNYAALEGHLPAAEYDETDSNS